ncbi:MAG TPA: arylsulfotransferase family protein [Thermoleophilaceae bacterium]|nr:arylsulfotransferase family protein [Thermoleophilaceae bacterium]
MTRCDPGEPVRLRIVTSDGERVRKVALEPGQGTSVVIRSGGERHRYHVRCLPRDFPRWRFERFRRPQAQWFLFAPQQGATEPESYYVTIIDGHGTPVWWRKRAEVPFNSILLPNGNVAWARWFEEPFGISAGTGWEVHRLDGPLVRTLRAKGSPTDLHDLVPLTGNHFLLFTYRVRRHVDLRPYGGPADGAVADGEIQEQDAAGKVVWRWNSKDHVSIGENTRWASYREIADGTSVYDWFHLNSVQPDGDGYIVSARHVDAVYRIDRATGRVTWKLGGTKRPESLNVVGNDRPRLFGGQHDARLLPDGTLTVFDNHTPDAPRAIRFRVDAAAKRAQVLGQATEPSLVWSPAEGSARLLPGSDWVVSWGATNLISELRATNDPTWRLTLSKGQSYRIQPILKGTLAATTLRRAMNKMHPR